MEKGFKTVILKKRWKVKNQIGPERVRRESPEAETLCARSHAPGQRFDQNFGFRGVEKRVKTVIKQKNPKNHRFDPIFDSPGPENLLKTLPRGVAPCTQSLSSGALTADPFRPDLI